MRACALLLALLLATASAQAQTPSRCVAPEQRQTYRDYWCPIIERILNARVKEGTRFRDNFQDDIEKAVSIQNQNLPGFALFAQARSRSLGFALVEDARIDKQIGAPAATSGSTSLVSKGSVPSILGFAVENGALTQGTNGTTITLGGTPVGLLDLVQNQGFIASYDDDARFTRALRRVSYSLTLNTSDTESPAVASGDADISIDAMRRQIEQTNQQLAGYSIRLALRNQRDPRTVRNREAVAAVLDTEGVALLNSDNAFNEFFGSDDYAIKWVGETTALLSDTDRDLSFEDIERTLYQQLEIVRLMIASRVEHFDEQVSGVLFALRAFEKARTRLFENMQKQTLVALEYVNDRVPEAPDRHTFRFIWEQQLGPRIDVTANVATTLQSGHAAPVPTSSDLGTRDFQASVQLDVPFGNVQKRVGGGSGIGVPVFAIAYLGKNLTDQATVTFGGQNFQLDKGFIHVVQGKLSIPVKGTGVKVPLSLSFANRSELVKEKKIFRGHVGLTFDLDVLTSLIR